MYCIVLYLNIVLYHPVIVLASAVILESCFTLVSALQLNPLNPKIKLSILICCRYSFPTEVVGRS